MKKYIKCLNRGNEVVTLRQDVTDLHDDTIKMMLVDSNRNNPSLAYVLSIEDIGNEPICECKEDSFHNESIAYMLSFVAGAIIGISIFIAIN